MSQEPVFFVAFQKNKTLISFMRISYIFGGGEKLFHKNIAAYSALLAVIIKKINSKL